MVSVFEFALYDLYVPFQAQAAEKAAWTQKAKAEAMARRHAAELDALQAGGVQYLFHICSIFFSVFFLVCTLISTILT